MHEWRYVNFLSSSSSNDILFKFEATGIKIDDEDKVLQFVWFLPSFYERLKHVLMYTKETLIFLLVISKLIMNRWSGFN